MKKFILMTVLFAAFSAQARISHNDFRVIEGGLLSTSCGKLIGQNSVQVEVFPEKRSPGFWGSNDPGASVQEFNLSTKKCIELEDKLDTAGDRRNCNTGRVRVTLEVDGVTRHVAEIKSAEVITGGACR